MGDLSGAYGLPSAKQSSKHFKRGERKFLKKDLGPKETVGTLRDAISRIGTPEQITALIGNMLGASKSLFNFDATQRAGEISDRMIQSASSGINEQMARSLGGRGLVGSGMAASLPNQAIAQAQGEIMSGAIQNAIQQELAAQQLAGQLGGTVLGEKRGFLDILRALTVGLGVPGISGRAGIAQGAIAGNAQMGSTLMESLPIGGSTGGLLGL